MDDLLFLVDRVSNFLLFYSKLLDPSTAFKDILLSKGHFGLCFSLAASLNPCPGTSSFLSCGSVLISDRSYSIGRSQIDVEGDWGRRGRKMRRLEGAVGSEERSGYEEKVSDMKIVRAIKYVSQTTSKCESSAYLTRVGCNSIILSRSNSWPEARRILRA